MHTHGDRLILRVINIFLHNIISPKEVQQLEKLKALTDTKLPLLVIFESVETCHGTSLQKSKQYFLCRFSMNGRSQMVDSPDMIREKMKRGELSI
mgnify:CR=1 FL=1